MTQWIIASSLGFVTGGALIWFSKNWIMSMVLTANELSAKLHAQADKIKAGL